MRPDVDDLVRATFVDTVRVAARTIATPAVAAAWTAPSCIARMTVGGVASHLYLAVRRVRIRLEREEPAPPGTAPWAVGHYYAPDMRIDGDDDLDSDNHVTLRADGEHVAARTHEVVARQLAEEAEHLDALVRSAPDDLVVPLGERAFRFNDYLATRIVEAVVHLDDVVCSCGLDLAVSPEALAIAVDMLVDVPRQRFGDLAVLRALARRERATPDVLRAL